MSRSLAIPVLQSLMHSPSIRVHQQVKYQDRPLKFEPLLLQSHAYVYLPTYQNIYLIKYTVFNSILSPDEQHRAFVKCFWRTAFLPNFLISFHVIHSWAISSITVRFHVFLVFLCYPEDSNLKSFSPLSILLLSVLFSLAASLMKTMK